MYSTQLVKPFLHEDSTPEAATAYTRAITARLRDKAVQRFYLTKVLDKDDPQCNDPRMHAAKLKEVKGLLDRIALRNTFQCK